MNSVVVTFGIFALYASTTYALQCYKCDSFEVTADSAKLKSLIEQKSTNKFCQDNAPLNAKTEYCPDDYSYSCGYIRAEVSGSVLFLGDFKSKSIYRGCMKNIGETEGCINADNNDAVMSIFKGIFGSVLTLSTGLTVSGDICYCDTDLCSAGCQVDGKVDIGGFCMNMPLVIFLGILCTFATIAIISGCFCCCCCCCCSPCKKPAGGVVHMNVQQPAAVFPQDNGRENPLYGVNQAV